MVKYQYEAFDDWFDELESYSFRSERFFQHLELLKDSAQQRNEFIENWLRAAFESGRSDRES